MRTALKFGVTIAGVGDIAASARRMEELGYDYLAAGEHVSCNVPISNSFISLAYAAAVTTRIKLLAGIVPLPLYPAALEALGGPPTQQKQSRSQRTASH